MTTTIQVPSIILPRVWSLGTETETIADLVEHTSLEFVCEYLQEKEVQILAIEAVAAGVPGPLWCWIELSPVPSTVSGNYWAAIGGGGNFLPPTAPTIEIGTGVHLTQHTILLPWAIHSSYARLVVQTPVAAALPLASWMIQAVVSGKK